MNQLQCIYICYNDCFKILLNTFYNSACIIHFNIWPVNHLYAYLKKKVYIWVSDGRGKCFFLYAHRWLKGYISDLSLYDFTTIQSKNFKRIWWNIMCFCILPFIKNHMKYKILLIIQLCIIHNKIWLYKISPPTTLSMVTLILSLSHLQWHLSTLQIPTFQYHIIWTNAI